MKFLVRRERKTIFFSHLNEELENVTDDTKNHQFSLKNTVEFLTLALFFTKKKMPFFVSQKTLWPWTGNNKLLRIVWGLTTP